MPLYLTENIHHIGVFSLWKLTENEEELLQMKTLSPEEKDYFLTITNGKRKKEWLTNRILLRHLLGENFSLNYLPDGKPVLSAPAFFVSISHSENFVAVFVSKHKEVGIDIERVRTNMESLKHKFLLPEECQRINPSDNLLLHLYWGAKEAMYKMYSSLHPLFTEHLSLSRIDRQQKTAIGEIKKDDFHKTVNILFREIEDNLLVCCFEN
ncbi:MAG: 4'-phosphopantetheinyl transferase superfamily protein [Bacteroidales bacterium]|jgi:4'-phosphopantetheinyl transferase EntD|nr:4'-phosphopantetheinyl transferase superfamily protein [Bacteroidales bacterium]